MNKTVYKGVDLDFIKKEELEKEIDILEKKKEIRIKQV